MPASISATKSGLLSCAAAALIEIRKSHPSSRQARAAAQALCSTWLPTAADEPGCLGDVDEMLGTEQTALRMVPADEGLDVGNPSGLQVDDRLVPDDELVGASACRSSLCTASRFCCVTSRRVVEDDDAVAPLLLGLLLGDAGVAHEPGCVAGD